MTNTVNIVERTMAQLRTAADTVNVVGGTGGRTSAYQPLTIRCTNHTADDLSDTDNVDGFALFHSKRHGSPWILGKSATAQQKIILKSGDSQDLDATHLYPDFDYTTFE